MPMVEWGSSIEIGVTKFDEHHQKLIAIINKLDEALGNPDRRSEVGAILRELSDYTLYHFRAEEDYMRRIQFPGYGEHVRQHQKLVHELDAYIDEFQAGRKIELGLLSFLTEWLMKHIVEQDRQYAAFARARGLDSVA